jgi:hypothetical protein
VTATIFYDNVTYSMTMSRIVGEAPENLTCARCKNLKPVAEFPVVTVKGKVRYGSYCTDCWNEYAREFRAKNLESSREKHRTYYAANRDRILANQKRHNTPERVKRINLKRLYGITPEEYEALSAAQNGACAVCKQPPRGVRPLHVDHDHATGAVRGLLCTTCNVGLGALQDSVELLRSALAYLEGR